jgi:diaminopimelate decarboxylase
MERNNTINALVGLSGDTPCYVYDLKQIQKQLDCLKMSFCEYDGYEPYYAVKANNNPEVLKLFINAGFGLAVSSPEELSVVLNLGCRQISYTAPYIDASAMKMIKENSFIEVNFNNLSESKRYTGKRFGIRVNPLIGDALFNEFKAGGKFSQFGVPFEELIKSETNPTILHMHISSDSNNIDVYLRAIGILLKIAELKSNVEAINIGGGFSIGFGTIKKPMDLQTMSKGIIKLLQGFQKKTGRRLRLQTELGSYLVRESGYFLTTIQEAESKFNRMYYFCNGSKHHLRGLQVLRSNIIYPIDKRSIIGGIYGKTCQRGDYLLESDNLPDLHRGDLIIINNAGAYCSVQANEFHLLPKPKEFVLNNKVNQ